MPATVEEVMFLDPKIALGYTLGDYRLATAEIFYCMPDYPALLQEYIWQELDLAPKYPALAKFLDFWERKIDGRLHSVKMVSSRLIRPDESKNARHLITLVH